MLKFYSLYSGSSGNSLLVKTENTNILVDAGVSSKKIETALTNLEIDPSSLDGILITHEHSDHVQGLGTFSKKFGIPVFVNQKTLDANLESQEELASQNNSRKKIKVEKKKNQKQNKKKKYQKKISTSSKSKKNLK